jgi:hypothetical protein
VRAARHRLRPGGPAVQRPLRDLRFIALGGELERGCFNATIRIGE